MEFSEFSTVISSIHNFCLLSLEVYNITNFETRNLLNDSVKIPRFFQRKGEMLLFLFCFHSLKPYYSSYEFVLIKRIERAVM